MVHRFTDSLEHIKTAHKERSEQLHAVEKAKHALEAAKREAAAKQEAREMHQMACRMLMDHIQTPRILDDDGNEWQYELKTDPEQAEFWSTHRIKKSEIKLNQLVKRKGKDM